jgi:uncharacterized coiled-coil protein SlyX
MENKESGKSNLTNENSIVRNITKTAKKEGVAKGALISGIIAFVVLISAALYVNSQFRQERNEHLALMEEQQNTFTKQVTERDSTINDWLLTFDQIEKDMNLIKQKENIITVNSSDKEFSKDKRGQVLEDIKYINTLLENNKKKIASLNAQLKNSGVVITGLQARVTSLETTIQQYETDIAGLKETLVKKDFEIGQLNTQMTALEQTITQKDEEITGQTLKLNEAFYTSGTYRELKDKGIVSKVGGFLGLGRRESMARDLNDSLFARIDVRDLKTIPINSKNAKLITRHPSDSYSLVQENPNKIAYLEIKNPELFWKNSKYAVVEIIK